MGSEQVAEVVDLGSEKILIVLVRLLAQISQLATSGQRANQLGSSAIQITFIARHPPET